MSETKKCPKCCETKPRAEFYKNRTRKDGLGDCCKPCHLKNVKTHQRNNADAVRKTRRDAARKNLVRKFGLSEVDRAEILRLQGCRCLICYALLKSGAAGHAMDHDHSTGKFRGFLCSVCNRGLGLFGDDPQRLREAAVYIERHKKG